MISEWYRDNRETLAKLEKIAEKHLIAPLRVMEANDPDRCPPGKLYNEKDAFRAATNFLAASDIDITSKKRKEQISQVGDAVKACWDARDALLKLDSDMVRMIDGWTPRTVGVEIPDNPSVAGLIDILENCSGHIGYTEHVLALHKLTKTNYRANSVYEASEHEWRLMLGKEPVDPGIRSEKGHNLDDPSEVTVLRGGPYGQFLSDVFEALDMTPQEAQSAYEHLRRNRKK